jgi:aryl-alcohol dehydrogenase-like predicted oxidoreductase
MKYRNLGKSGLKVSEISLGTMTFGSAGMFKDYGGTDINESKKIVDYAIDKGINLFDTADSYSGGKSEETLGKALNIKRKDVLISTKIRFGVNANNINGAGLSKYNIIKGCDASLKRLGTDYIDIYLLHAYDQDVPLEETLSAFDDLIRQGKVRYIGCSNFAAWEAMKALCISEKNGFDKFVTYQAYYSLASREVENEIMPLCLDQGLGITCWSPLSGGFFTGKYRKNKPKPSQGRRVDSENVTNIFAPVEEKKGYEIVEILEKVAAKHNATISQVSLSYLLSKKAVSSVVVGIKQIKHLEENIQSTELALDYEDLNLINKISEPYYPYPHWFKKTIWEKDGIRV